MDPNQYPPSYPASEPGAPLPPGAVPAGAPLPPGAVPTGGPLPPGTIPAGYVPGTYAPAPRRRRRGRIISVIVGIVVVIAIGVGATLFLQNPDAGKVVFTLKEPSNCRVSDQITSASAGAGTLHVVGILKDSLHSGDTITIDLSVDGKYVTSSDPISVDKTVGCYDDQEQLTGLPAGTYKFTFKAGGKVEAEGSIDIKN